MAWAKTSYSESIHDFIAVLHRQLIEATSAWDGRFVWIWSLGFGFWILDFGVWGLGSRV
jgi:hypothetical protein